MQELDNKRIGTDIQYFVKHLIEHVERKTMCILMVIIIFLIAVLNVTDHIYT